MKKIRLSMLVVLLISMVGCGLVESGQLEADSVTTESNSEIDSGQKADQSEDEKKHIIAKISESVSIDAYVEKEPKTVKIYGTESKTFSKEDCISCMVSETTGEVKEVFEDEYGFDLNTMNDFMIFGRNEAGYIYGSYPEMESLRDAIFYLNNARAMSSDTVIDEIVPDEIIDKATEYIKSIVPFDQNEKLQVVTGIKVESREKLLNYYTKLYPDGNEEENSLDCIKAHYEMGEQMYYIEFTLSVDDIPLMGMKESGINTVIDMDDFYMPNQICLILTDKEVKYFSADNLYNPTEYEEKEIMSVDEAVEILKTKYNQQFDTGSDIVFDRVWLEYLPVPCRDGSDECELTPYWCFQQSANGASGWFELTAERINAITGGDLSYGE